MYAATGLSSSADFSRPLLVVFQCKSFIVLGPQLFFAVSVSPFTFKIIFSMVDCTDFQQIVHSLLEVEQLRSNCLTLTGWRNFSHGGHYVT